jgi:hypothetical protein
VLHKINQSQEISSRNYYLLEEQVVIQLVETAKSLHKVRESHRVVVQQRLALKDVHNSFSIAQVDLSKKGSTARHAYVSRHMGETTKIARPVPLLQLSKTVPAINVQTRTWLRKIISTFMTARETQKIQQETLDKRET